MTLPSPTLVVVFTFVLGAVVGSFLNVVIHRLPRGQSLVQPRSRCPRCEQPVPYWANVPILSYLALRGRCHSCKAPIDIRYLLVELATALLFTVLLLRWGPGVRLLGQWLVGSVLIAIAFIDGEHRIIPDPLTLPLIPLGFVFATFTPPPTAVHSLAGLGIGGGMLWTLAYVYERRTGQIGLGMGDVKLVAMMGAWIGIFSVFGMLLVGSLIGLVQGVWVLLRGRGGRKTPIPFGPALVAAGLLHLYAPMWLYDLQIGALWR